MNNREKVFLRCAFLLVLSLNLACSESRWRKILRQSPVARSTESQWEQIFGPVQEQSAPVDKLLPKPKSIEEAQPEAFVKETTPAPGLEEKAMKPVVAKEPIIELSERSLVQPQARSPIVRRFGSGQVVLASTNRERLSSFDGQEWTVENPPFWQGTYLEAMTMADGRMITYGHQPLEFNFATKAWEYWYNVFQSPMGAYLNQYGRYRMRGMPISSSRDVVYPFHLFTHNGIFYFTVMHLYKTSLEWRGKTVQGSLVRSHLLRASRKSLVDFDFVSTITSVESLPPLTHPSLPLYYGAEVRCTSLGKRLVCVGRTTADNDDIARRLDPDQIFQQKSPKFQDRHLSHYGADQIDYVYSPRLDSNLFYRGEVRQPPISLSISDDDGKTWQHSYTQMTGVTPEIAYDAENDILVVASAGLWFPRRGVAIQVSFDQGATWTDPLLLDDSSEGFNSGAVGLICPEPGKFILYYDIMPYGTVLKDGKEDNAMNKIYSRVIRIEKQN